MHRWLATVGFCVALCAGHARSVADSPCAPSVVVSGDPQAVTAVRDQLRTLGVRTEASADCPNKLQAHVLRDDEGLAIELRDTEGRSHRRSVSAADVAAMWIESWTRKDISSPLLPMAWQPPTPVLRTTATPVAQTTNVLVRRSMTPPATPTTPVHVGVRAESLTGSDDSSWTGIGVGACIRIGGICVGMSGRYSANLAFSKDDAMVETDRKALDLAATIAVPLSVGRGTLTAELSLGGRWLTSRGTVPIYDAPVPCDPNGDPNLPPNDPDPANPDGTDPGEPVCENGMTSMKVANASRLLRTGARLSYAVPISDAAAITLGVGATWLPGAHSNNFQEGSSIGPDGTIIDDPTIPPDPSRAIPGEPGWLWSAGVGVRVELK